MLKDCIKILNPIYLELEIKVTIILLRLMFSSDKKYFIVVMEEYTYDSNKFYMEIRARENLGEIFFQKEFSLGELFNWNTITFFDVDLINGSQIVVKSDNFIYTSKIKSGSNSNNLQVDH
jgi:hypothetical protein